MKKIDNDIFWLSLLFGLNFLGLFLTSSGVGWLLMLSWYPAIFLYGVFVVRLFLIHSKESKEVKSKAILTAVIFLLVGFGTCAMNLSGL
jgi:hypothetical protein